jgi:PAS domain-containing protein
MQTDELGSRAGELRAQLDQTEELLQLAPAAIVVRDPETSAIRFWNRGAEDLYGWTPEEALGQVSHNLLRTVFPVPLAQISAVLDSLGHWEGDLVHTGARGPG